MIGPGDKKANFLTVTPLGPATHIVGFQAPPKHKATETYIRLDHLTKIISDMQEELINDNETGWLEGEVATERSAQLEELLKRLQPSE